MEIGNVKLKNRVISAPLAGVTDACCRQIYAEHGAGLLYTEMVSAKGLMHGNITTRALLRVCDATSKSAAQIFGSCPNTMAKAAYQIVNEYPNIDIIDINCGCPAPKIVRNGEGSALMRDPNLVGQIVNAICKAISPKPVTIKIRKGYSEGECNYVQVALQAEANGASAVAVHPRTRPQMYSGKADWSVIADVKRHVKIPVIGNGDIRTPEDAARMIAETGCNAVMIGRGVWGNPWLLSRTVEYMKNGILPPPPTNKEIIETAARHMHMLIDAKGQKVGISESRKHLAMYTKGLPGGSASRILFNKATTAAEMEEALNLLL